jgi:cell division protein FtsN
MKVNKFYIAIAIAAIITLCGVIYFGTGANQQASIFALENNPIDGINPNTIDDSEQVIDYTESSGAVGNPIVGSSTQ